MKRIGRLAPEIWILIGILLLGIGLRLAGLWWGLPVDAYTGHYNPDEPKVLRAIAEFPSYIWRSHYLNYPTLYPFFLALITYPIRGLIQNVPLLFTTNDPRLGYYLLARLGGVVTGVMAVYGTYWLYRRYDKTIGLLAAAFLAVAMIHVSNSPLGTLDVPSSLVAILAMMAVFRVVEQPSRRTYVWLGLALGALGSVRYASGMVALSALFAHGLAWWKRREERGWWWRALVDRHLWLMILLALGVLLVTTPGILVHPNDFWEDVVYETARFDEQLDDDPDSHLSLATWSEATEKLVEVVGLPLGIAILIGVGRAFWRPTYRQLLPLVFVGSYYFLFVQNLRRRYFIVLVPFMCIFAATWLIEAYRLRPGRIWRAAIGGVILIIFAASLGYSVAGIHTRLAPDPRDMAAHWMDQNAPYGSTVGFGYISSCESGLDAPIYEMRFRTLEGQLGPDYLVLDNCVFKRLRSVPADSFEFRFYDDILNETGQVFKYEMVERFDPYKLVPLDLGASEVFLYRSQWLEQQQFQLPTQLTLHGANWEGQIELAGYRCEGCDNPRQSEPLEVMLCWRTLSTLTQDYTTFLHLVDAQGDIVAQTDQQPLRGGRPTSRWVPDEVLCDTLQMTIPTESAGGEYQHKLGWYDALSGQRLAVGQDDSVTLPPFTVIGRD